MLSCEVVLLHVLLDEGLGLLTNLSEVSKVCFADGVGLWETQLGLDLVGQERKSLGSIVLDSAWHWNVHVVVDIVSSVWEHGRSFSLSLREGTNLLHSFQSLSHNK